MSVSAGSSGTPPTLAELEAAVAEHGSIRAAATALGRDESTIRRRLRKAGKDTPAPAVRALSKGGYTVTGDEATATSPAVPASELSAMLGTRDAEQYLRDRWGFPVDLWHCVSATGNEWMGPVSGGGAQLLAQVKGTFRKHVDPVDLAAILPAPAAYKPVPKPRKLRRTSAPWQAVILADHQAPYIDDDLHAATLAMIRDKQPRRIGHIGDLCDYTDISRHNDHAVVKASVDDCTQSGVDILAAIRHAAPDSQIDLLEGNHDIRPMAELLARAERMAGIRCGDLRDGKGREEILSLRRLWRLDELGINLVSDPRGWQHGELEIVPGPAGLVAVHGWLTGKGVATRTMEKVGRSVLMGHTHGPEHVFKWNTTLRIEQQAMVVGCQCEVRGGKHFPTFAPHDGWLQGPAVVTVHSDGEFTLERARWNGESLFVGRDRWTPK